MANNVTRNWKTTLLGVLGLTAVGAKVASTALDGGAAPAIAAALNPDTSAQIALALGLLVAKDSDKSGTITKQK